MAKYEDAIVRARKKQQEVRLRQTLLIKYPEQRWIECLKAIQTTCSLSCQGFLRNNFKLARIREHDENVTALLQRAEMARYHARLFSLEEERMAAVLGRNCPQWEASFQCMYACTDDLPHVLGLRKLLKGNEALSVNSLCRSSDLFSRALPCAAKKADHWLHSCEPQLLHYEANKTLALSDSDSLFLEAQRAAESALRTRRSLRATLTPFFYSLWQHQDAMCSSYAAFLSCALPRLADVCSPLVASFLHSSLSSTFLETVLPGRHGVQRFIGSVAPTCQWLQSKSNYNLPHLHSRST